MTIVSMVGQIALGAWMAPGAIRYARELGHARRAYGAGNVNPMPIVAYGRMGGHDVQIRRDRAGCFHVGPLRPGGTVPAMRRIRVWRP